MRPRILSARLMALAAAILAAVLASSAAAAVPASAAPAAPAAPAAATPAPLAWSYPQLLGPSSLYGEASSLTGLSCPSNSLCVASDRDGSVLVADRPQAGVAAWQVMPLAGGARLVGISCPTTRLCLTASEDGRVYISTNPTLGPASWTEVRLTGLGLVTAVGCSSSGTCAVVDDAGDVAATTGAATAPSTAATTSSTTAPAATGTSGWTTSQVDLATRPCGDGGRCQVGFTAVACPAAGECVAFDQVGNVATTRNATGGASAWQVLDVDARGYNAAAGSRPGCPEGFCVRLSCPQANACVAADSSGYIVTTSDPTGPATAWIARPLTGLGGSPTALSCTSASACTLADAADELLSSRDPAGGAPAWTLTPFAPAQVPGDPATLGVPQGVACPSPRSCFAVDDQGNLVAGLPAASPAQVHGLAGAVAAWHAYSGLRALGASATLSLPFNAPQAGEVALAWGIRVTIPGRVKVTIRKRGKKRTRRVIRIPARAQTLIVCGHTLVLGRGPGELSLSLTARQRRLLRSGSRATVLATALFESSSGIAGKVQRTYVLHR